MVAGHAVEQPGLRGKKRAGADADDAPRVLGGCLDPRDDVGVLPGLVDAHTAGQDDGVDAPARVGQRLSDEREPGAGGGRLTVLRDDGDGVAVVGAILALQVQRRAGEHLRRADQIECLDARISEDQHRPGHESSVGDQTRGVYAVDPTH